MGYVGLVAREASSGTRTWRGGITKTGNAHVRRIVGEVAWAYRHRPAVAQVQHQLVVQIDVLIGAPAGPQRFAGDVLGDAKQPGRKLRLFSQRLQPAISAHERFLRQLLSQLPIANLIVDKANHRSRVPFKDQPKCFLIALARARDEVC